MSQTSADLLTNQSSIQIADINAQNSSSLVPHLVAAQATIRPEGIAAVHGKALLTYKELHQRADRLACFLQSRGVGPDVVVGIYLNRSLAMLVASLAVMKAGGAYLPLDPTYPAERLTFMLNNAQATILVTAECLRDALPQRPKHLVILDSEGRFEGDVASSASAARLEPRHLAYVIYTSGSTGQPKGVEITHQGLSNLVSWHQRAFKVGPTDRASQLSALGFDAAVWEIWPYLAAGARVYM